MRALVALALAAAACSAHQQPLNGRAIASRRDVRVPRSAPLLASRSSPPAPPGNGLGHVGGLAALAVASELMQYTNTALLILLLRRLTRSETMSQLAEAVIGWLRARGGAAYPIYVALLVGLQALPLFSALLFIVLAGAVFGAVRGTAVVSLSLTLAAVMCCAFGRAIAGRAGYSLDRLSLEAAAVDIEIATQRPRTSLLLCTLIRLSPVVPFTFSNYLFGLTSVSYRTLGLATLLGTLPTQAAYVTAGALGQQALSGELSLPPALLLAGTLATVGAVVLVGKVAQSTLSKMELDISATQSGGRRQQRQPRRGA
mmetsp:Transcript_21945/g.70077  ORF Transcript_21945/g.70077 Transcript_21945/m.70077 type:complete len:314 (+) Transcript_21945:15-956(+)